MKKVLIALLVLGALVVVPETEANARRGRKCHKKEKCMKEETGYKKSCPDSCEEVTVLDHVEYRPISMPGRQKVNCYKTYKTCTNVSECCKKVPCEKECIPFDKTACEEVE